MEACNWQVKELQTYINLLHVINCTRRRRILTNDRKVACKLHIFKVARIEIAFSWGKNNEQWWSKTFEIRCYGSLTLTVNAVVREHGLCLFWVNSCDTVVKLRFRADKGRYVRLCFLSYLYPHGLLLCLLSSKRHLRRHDTLPLCDQCALSTVAISPPTISLVPF